MLCADAASNVAIINTYQTFKKSAYKPVNGTFADKIACGAYHKTPSTGLTDNEISKLPL